MAPMKTLAECVRIRATAEASSIAASESQRKLQSDNSPLNGFLLARPRFGLTVEELRTDIISILNSVRALAFDISFLPSEEIVIKARPSTPAITISNDAIATSVRSIKPALASTIASKKLAYSVQLCALDSSLNILRTETDIAGNHDGWSQVAAKGAASRIAPRQTPVGERSVYTVLGSKLKDAKKKKEEALKAQEVVVDDWEEEVRKDEQQAGEDVGKDPAVVDISVGFLAEETLLPDKAEGGSEELEPTAGASESQLPLPSINGIADE